MELVALLLLVTFEGIVGGVAVLLTLTYLSFRRMEKNVRRARMFIMADRIQRFLGAFTVGFIVLAAVFATIFLGVTLSPAISGGAFFFFLATIAYGVVELFFIVRPRHTARAAALKSLRSVIHRGPSPTTPQVEPTGDEADATR
jgi:hypothetical protein